MTWKKTLQLKNISQKYFGLIFCSISSVYNQDYIGPPLKCWIQVAYKCIGIHKKCNLLNLSEKAKDTCVQVPCH